MPTIDQICLRGCHIILLVEIFLNKKMVKWHKLICKDYKVLIQF